jgi:GT2 family glycosyltransferase
LTSPGLGNHPEVTISVLATRDVETIGPCVASVLALSYPGTLDVRIREHGQDDEQFARIEAAVAAAGSDELRTVTLTRGENIGFARGHNAAIRDGSGDLVLLVNADSELDPDFLMEAVAAFDDPQVGTVQPKVLRHRSAIDGTRTDAVIDTVGLLPSRKRLVLSRGQGHPDDGRYDAVEEVFGADGAVVMYRRSALDSVAVPLSAVAGRRQDVPDHDEYFDESFFIYKEDVDLAWRLGAAGWKALFVPTARAWHIRSSRRDADAKSPLAILASRKAMPELSRYLSFGNHRLMQVKNETWRGLGRDFVPWIVYEAGTWLFFVATDTRIALRAIRRMIGLMPLARRKRRLVQLQRRVDADVYRWFN